MDGQQPEEVLEAIILDWAADEDVSARMQAPLGPGAQELHFELSDEAATALGRLREAEGMDPSGGIEELILARAEEDEDLEDEGFS